MKSGIFKSKNKSRNISVSGKYGIWGTNSGNVGGNVGYSQSKSEGKTYNNSQIIAGNKLYSRSDELIIKGGNLKGKETDVETKKLVLESLQDTSKYREIGVGIGVNAGKGKEKYTYSGNGEVTVVKGDKEWVGIQSSITGTEKIRVKADEGYLKGGLIGNIDENGKDRGNLTVEIKKLLTEDIESKDKKVGAGIRASITEREKVPTDQQIHLKDENGNPIKGKEDKVGTDYGASIEGHNREKVTRATIGNGVLTVGEQNGPLNRDVYRSDEILKDVNVKKVNVDFVETKKGWGEIGGILATDAGIIGKFADDVNEKLLNNEPKNIQGEWTEKVYKTIRRIEDFVDKKLKNETLPIIPTAGQNGGMLEGIQMYFKKDKFDIYDIVLEEDKNGKPVITGKKLKNASEITNNEILINGMTEESEGSIANAINQLVSMDEIKNKMKKEPVKITLIYSKTRGGIIDGAEAVLGKMFDGSKTNFHLTTGTSRGLADVLMQLDPKREFNITTYSQANIIMMGALNYLNNKGKTLNGNITLYHTGTPIAPKAFDALTGKLHFTNGVSMINTLDPVGSERGKLMGLKGIVSETRDFDQKPRTKRDALSSKISFIGPSMLRDQVYPMLTLKKKEKYTPEEISSISQAHGFKKYKQFTGYAMNYHGRYMYEDREFVARELEQLNSGKSMDEIKEEINKIRAERQNVMFDKMKYGPVVTTEQIIDFRTNILFDEFIENLGAQWRERERIPENRRVEDLHINGNTKRNATQSIDDMVANLRRRVR